jgi:tol-pal system protein YbgF
MKTKNTFLKGSCLALSLCITGVAFAVADVESHAYAGDPAQNQTLDLLQKIEFLQREMQELRGKVEEQSYQISQLKKMVSPASAVPTQAAPAAQAPAAQVPAQPQSQSIEQQPAVEVPATSFMQQDQALAEEKAYQHAYRLIQNKDYQGATMAFKSMIKTFPEGKYLPNGHYWLGEIYMAKGDLQLAYEAFDSVYKKFPDHPKAADSLLKLGYVEYAKGQWKRSQALLTQVKNEFPGSTSAQLAEAKLQLIQKENN